ncbi:MAG TPA: aspartate kinase [Patescibacteria group bacterium]|nr:aspartate kinase [Patescibacteria group bacterium]
MQIVVQKFGGTSVATPATRALAAEKVKMALTQGLMPVVVVSAMGRRGDTYATDTLLDLAVTAGDAGDSREIDLIMCCGEMISAVVMSACLRSQKLQTVMLTGGQAGIVTDDNYNSGKILKINPARIHKELAAGRIPVICGFQGMTEAGEFTTLGRGGSDTTAAALGVALDAQLVEIYTDVDGIMTADPKIVKNARILDRVSYSQVCQMAHQGAKVIHPRAVEMAMQKNIPLVIKSTFSDAPGTLVTQTGSEETECRELAGSEATGVTYLVNLAQVRICPRDNGQGDAGSTVFRALANADIPVDFINIHPGEIVFTVRSKVVEQAAEIARQMGYQVQVVPDCAKVTVVGGAVRETPGVLAGFIEALSGSRVNILQTVDSPFSISVLVAGVDVEIAVNSLHEAFAPC